MKTDTISYTKGYSDVNDLRMYYEIHGTGKPLVLIHGGGSTINTSFGRVMPFLAKNRQVIAVEMQAHGRTGDRTCELSFEQDADDVAVLLKNLKIQKADFFGFSNGGTTTLQIAIRHPELINKIILGSPLAKRNGVPPQFFDFMKQASLDNMPQELKEAYLKDAPDHKALQVMHGRDVKRMLAFKDIPDEKLKLMDSPALIIGGDKDVITLEHLIELHRLITNSDLAIIPGIHGEYMGEITTIKNPRTKVELVCDMIERFLNDDTMN